MKKTVSAWIAGVVAGMLIPAGASAAGYTASDYCGAELANEIITVTETEAEIIYEWYQKKAGIYQVSFPSAAATACTVTLQINDGAPITISDITKAYEMGFDAGINRITVKVGKSKSTSVCSLGNILLTETEKTISENLHLECNDYTTASGECYYYENYGSDMSNGDVRMFRAFGKTASAEYMLYAPYDGVYVTELAMSDINQNYTSDVKMSVNGTDYLLNAQTVSRVKSLSNASDAGLMKLLRMKNAVTLRKGMNRIVFSSTESRSTSDSMHIFFLDCVKFTFSEDSIAVNPQTNAVGDYTYSVFPANGARYMVEVEMTTDKTAAHALASCSVNGVTLTKGSAEKNLSDATVRVLSEYEEDGKLIGRYQLKESILPGNQLTVKIGADTAFVSSVTCSPVTETLGGLYARTDRDILLPGETASISIFAKDAKGYAYHIPQLRKAGAVTYQSSDRDILVVDANGQVTALKPGIATVTVAASDGVNTYPYEQLFHIYHEEYGFAVLDAQKKDGEVKVKLLSPFGTKSEAHQMYIAEYDGTQLVSVSGYPVETLAEGQVKTYTLPDSGNEYKVISVSATDNITPVYDAVVVREE